MTWNVLSIKGKGMFSCPPESEKPLRVEMRAPFSLDKEARIIISN